ncbi:MAG: hypothetical protein ABI600_03285 [Luteolibacter sp.]
MPDPAHEQAAEKALVPIYADLPCLCRKRRLSHSRLGASNTARHILKKYFQLLIVFLGCLQLVGGPYFMMQVYAWAGMLVCYSQDDGIVKAVKETFSGEKPCALCCKITAALKAERDGKEPLVPFSSSLSAKQLKEMIATREVRLVFPRPCALPPAEFSGVLSPNGMAPASPPTPPPRVAA